MTYQEVSWIVPYEYGAEVMLPIASLIDNPYQQRAAYDEIYIHRLADNISENGQERAIKVRPSPDQEGKYEIAYGHQGVKALILLGGSEVRGVVTKLNDKQMHRIVFNENNLHQQLSDYDVARWINMEISTFGSNQSDVSEIIQKHPSEITRYLRLIQLETDGIMTKDTLLHLDVTHARSFRTIEKAIWSELGAFLNEEVAKRVAFNIPIYERARNDIKFAKRMLRNRYLEDDVPPVPFAPSPKEVDGMAQMFWTRYSTQTRIERELADSVVDKEDYDDSPLNQVDPENRDYVYPLDDEEPFDMEVEGINAMEPFKQNKSITQLLDEFYTKNGFDTSAVAAIMHVVANSDLAYDSAMNQVTRYRTIKKKGTTDQNENAGGKDYEIDEPTYQGTPTELADMIGNYLFKAEGYVCPICSSFTNTTRIISFLNRIEEKDPNASKVVYQVIKEKLGETSLLSK